MGGISIWQLLIIAVIVVLLFGTKKLGSIGSDLGASIKGFKKAMSDDEPKQDKTSQDADFTAKTIADKQADTNQEQAKQKTRSATIKSRCNLCLISVLANCYWCSSSASSFWGRNDCLWR
ncbi:twin arginine translocase protein A [Escherichia coli]|uniref:Sec-independent protein translocase protein TatA n=1 Tax=Escherichia coli TaxID=562 RepID=A0A376WAE9_ECOLX|nr:twin arginine translocase protein A [Escherichia coli]